MLCLVHEHSASRGRSELTGHCLKWHRVCFQQMSGMESSADQNAVPPPWVTDIPPPWLPTATTPQWAVEEVTLLLWSWPSRSSIQQEDTRWFSVETNMFTFLILTCPNSGWWPVLVQSWNDRGPLFLVFVFFFFYGPNEEKHVDVSALAFQVCVMFFMSRSF